MFSSPALTGFLLLFVATFLLPSHLHRYSAPLAAKALALQWPLFLKKIRQRLFFLSLSQGSEGSLPNHWEPIHRQTILRMAIENSLTSKLALPKGLKPSRGCLGKRFREKNREDELCFMMFCLSIFLYFYFFFRLVMSFGSNFCLLFNKEERVGLKFSCEETAGQFRFYLWPHLAFHAKAHVIL